MVVVLVCGGGNGAHALAGLASSCAGTEVRVLTLYADEAVRWNTALSNGDFLTHIHHPKQPINTLTTKPTLVTKQPEVAVPESDIIILTVPAFAHAQYLQAIRDYVKSGTVIIGLPGQPGFEFDVFGILGALSTQCTLVSFESLPWACRIVEFGQAVDILGTKDSLMGAIKPGSIAPPADPVGTLQICLGPRPTLITKGHLLGITLMAPNGYGHSSILYGQWHDWDGKALDEPPLFYQGLTTLGADLMCAMSQEIVGLAKKISADRPEIDLSNVIHIYDFFIRVYGAEVGDLTSLYTAIRTNKPYQGLVHPMTKTPDGKYVPDFQHRYLSEDIPFGLLVTKGIAEVVNVVTPTIDRVLSWCQEKLGKSYMVNGKVCGSDINSTRCPQRYGLNTLDALLGM